MRLRFLIVLALTVMTVAFGFCQLSTHPAPAAQMAAAPPLRIAAEGRVMPYPGAEVIISSELPGTLIELPVDEKHTVHKGELLAQLRCDDQRAQLAEAQARIAESEAEMRYYQSEVKRLTDVVATGAGSHQELDKNQWEYEAADARRQAAQATANRISVILDKMRIVAPMDATVLKRIVQPGETVTSSQQLLTLADLSRTRVEAEVDEFDAGRITLGMPVLLTAEGYPDRVWHGHVEQIPDSVIDRQTRPEDPGKPSDTRILLVKIHLDEPTPFKLRQRVEVMITPTADAGQSS